MSKKNIGPLSKSQLNKELSNITGISDKKGPKRNRNGKQGIDKTNCFKMNPDAPRKCCFKCGNTNHLALDCRKKIRKKTEIPLSDKSGRSVRFKPDNPCSHCGSKMAFLFMFVLLIIICIKTIMNLCPSFIRVQIMLKRILLKFIGKLIQVLSQILME